MESFEGNRLKAYDDAQPHTDITDWDQVKGVLTIGRGHTGDDVYPGQIISEAESLRLFHQDIANAEAEVKKAVRVPLLQCEYDSSVSIYFNVGPGGTGKSGISKLKNGNPSSLLRELNSGNYLAAADQFAVWWRTPGFEWGLWKRRICERLLFKGLPWESALSQLDRGMIGLMMGGSPIAPFLDAADDHARRQQLEDNMASIHRKHVAEPPENLPPSLPEPDPVESEPAPTPEPVEKKTVTPDHQPTVSSVPYGRVDPAADPKDMIASKRFWGMLIMIVARFSMLGTVFQTAIGEVTQDPILFEAATAGLAMGAIWLLDVGGQYMHKWGKADAKALLK